MNKFHEYEFFLIKTYKKHKIIKRNITLEKTSNKTFNYRNA